MQIEKAYLFARQISGQPPLPSKSYLFNNGVFNTEWVRDDFSLSNYVDVVGSMPAGDEDYMDYNVRKYYWGNTKSYVDTGSCLYVRDTGSSICTLTQDNTFIIDTTQCQYEYTGVQDDTANMFCIRLREDHINRYNSEKGYLASTTGNITGIYDMSGGAWEYVMGNYGTEKDGVFYTPLIGDITCLEMKTGKELFHTVIEVVGTGSSEWAALQNARMDLFGPQAAEAIIHGM